MINGHLFKKDGRGAFKLSEAADVIGTRGCFSFLEHERSESGPLTVVFPSCYHAIGARPIIPVDVTRLLCGFGCYEGTGIW